MRTSSDRPAAAFLLSVSEEDFSAAEEDFSRMGRAP
jgi:hypothetical protein